MWGRKGDRLLFIERPTARMLEALGAANSTRTNQKAVSCSWFVISMLRPVKTFKSFNRFVTFKLLEGMKTSGNFHVSGILETWKCMLITSQLLKEMKR